MNVVYVYVVYVLVYCYKLDIVDQRIHRRRGLLVNVVYMYTCIRRMYCYKLDGIDIVEAA